MGSGLHFQREGLKGAIHHPSEIRMQDPELPINLACEFKDEFFQYLQQQKYFILLIDKSGSMRGSKWKNVLRIINTVKGNSHRLNIQDNIYCIFFDKVVAEDYRGNIANFEIDMDRNEVIHIEDLSNLTPNDGTNIAKAMILAIKQIQEINESERDVPIDEFRTILLTDGLPTNFYGNITQEIDDGLSRNFINDNEEIINQIIENVLSWRNTFNESELVLERNKIKKRQTEIVSKLFRGLSNLHIIALGEGEDRDPNLMNSCINNAHRTDNKNRNENEVNHLLWIPESEKEIENISFHITKNIMENHRNIAPELNMIFIIEGLADVFDILFVSDNTEDDDNVEYIPRDEIIDESDFKYGRILRDVHIDEEIIPARFTIHLNPDNMNGTEGERSFNAKLKFLLSNEFKLRGRITFDVVGKEIQLGELLERQTRDRVLNNLEQKIRDGSDLAENIQNNLEMMHIKDGRKIIPELCGKIDSVCYEFQNYINKLEATE